MGSVGRPRSLSGAEARVVRSLEADGRAELSLDDIERRAGVRRGFARKIAHGLLRKGWVQRLGGGRYLLNPTEGGAVGLPDTDPLRFGGRLVRPYYFGYGTAAELFGLLPQAGHVYYLVSPRRRSVRQPHAAQFRLIHVARKRFFGVRTLRRRGESIRVSDLEKTVLDCLERPDLAGGIAGVVQIVASAKPRIDWARLLGHARRLGNRSLLLRLGFLFDVVRPELPMPATWSRRARARPGEPFVPLGPPATFGRRGVHDLRWRVIQNVPDRLLFSELEVR